MAGKITGMLLELDPSQLDELLAFPEHMADAVRQVDSTECVYCSCWCEQAVELLQTNA